MAAKVTGGNGRRSARGLSLAFLALVALLSSFDSHAVAAPVHAPLPDPLHGFALDKACGAAVDGEGDVYVANAGEGKVEVFDPAGAHLASIADANTPCGLAVDSKGRLYVSEKATGKVLQYRPDEYPLSGSPSYGPPVVIDASGAARGISIDPADDRLYVAEGSQIASFQADGTTGQDEVQQVYVQKGVTGGSFRLRFAGEETGPIAADPAEAKPSDGEIQTALESLAAIGAGNVEVEAGTRGARSHRVTFTHALGSQNVASLEVNNAAVLGGVVSVEFPLEGAAFSGHVGEGELSGATAVAAYTYDPAGKAKRFLFATDAANTVKVFTGTAVTNLAPSGEIDGKAVPDSEACPECAEGFGPLGSGLAADWATGHLFVYDAAHAVVDEFEPSGRYLDQVHSAAFADAEPSGLAVLPGHDEAQEVKFQDSIGGSFKLGFAGDETAPLPFEAGAAQVQAALEALASVGAGNVAVNAIKFGNTRYRVRFTGALGNRNVAKLTVDDAGLAGAATARAFVDTLEPGYGPARLYVSAGTAAGARLLGFGPLAPPSRAPLPALSHALPTARAVAVDSHGDVYAAAGALVHLYDPSGNEITTFEDKNGATDLDVDSTGKVYVLDSATEEVTYYTPSEYPPTPATAYVRHEPAVAKLAHLKGIGVDSGNGHLFITTESETIELGAAGEGSPLVKSEIGAGLGINQQLDVAVRAANGYLYFPTAQEAIWVVDPARGEHGEVVARITGAGSPDGSPGANPQVAVDEGSGHAVSFDNSRGAAQEFEQAGAFVAGFGEFTRELAGRTYRIAVDNGPSSPNRGTVYVAFDDTKAETPDVWAFGPLSYGQPPAAKTAPAGGLGGGGATLHGAVDPNGFEVTACSFEYTTEADFQLNGFEGAEAETAACEPEASQLGKGSGFVPVQAQVSGLDPAGRYRYRLVAENAFGAAASDQAEEAGLFGAPGVEARRAVPVLYDEATLRAAVDPAGVATTYFFEYGTGEAYGHATPLGEIAASAGKTEVKAALTGLEEGRTYHFRLVAKSEAGETQGADGTFQTQERASESCANAEFRTGLSAGLPDCRAYELVSPGDTNGAAVGVPSPGTSALGFNHWLTVPRGSGAGEALTFLAEPTLPGFEGSGVHDDYRAERAPGAHPALGWQSQLLSFSYVQDGGGGSAWRGAASDQRYAAWTNKPLLSFEETLPEGSYLRTPGSAAPANCNPQSQPHFELVGCGDLGPDPQAEPQFLAAGGQHVIFSSGAHLEPGAPPAGVEAIYDRPAESGSAELVSSEPGGGGFGTDARFVADAEDGAAVVFRVGGALYLHRQGQSAEVAAAPAAFAGISEGGSKVLFAAGAGDSPAPLFSCDLEAGPCVGGGEAGLTEIAAKGIFVGASADGSHAFFSSEEALTAGEEDEVGETAQPGQRNLYAWDEGVTRFVAVLDAGDFAEFGGTTELSLREWTAALTAGTTAGRGNVPTRATPGGGVFVFQSHAQIGKYDNEGRGEIYRYAPAAAAGQRLLCVSCDPSGAPPGGDALLEKLGGSPTVLHKKTIIPNLTDDGGEIFFQSADRLVPGDANDALDVYEWKADGVGGCGRSDGCLALISSGQGERPSFLYSMSADGRDVFIQTLDRLVSADVAGSASIYDARVDGGIPAPAEPEACHGDACQPAGAGAPSLDQPATTEAEGNLVERGRCPRGKHRVKGRCVSSRHRRHAHRHRAHRRGGRRR